MLWKNKKIIREHYRLNNSPLSGCRGKHKTVLCLSKLENWCHWKKIKLMVKKAFHYDSENRNAFAQSISY